MERLTERNENGKKEAYYPYCFREDTCDGDGPSEKCVACALSTKICEKLAEYEDTGLTPDEIREMQELLSRENGKETTRFSRDNDSWIPVEERLPEDEAMMLVTCQTKAGRRSVNRAWYGAGCWHGTGSMSGVTAWMPLPDPYSPERSSNEEE